MKAPCRSLTKGEVTEALSYLPPKHKDLVGNSVWAYNIRKKNKRGQVIEGSYLPKDGRIIVYSFTPAEILTKRYLNTLWHEVGHKVFDELLARKEKAIWENVRDEETFIIDLSDLYIAKNLWEEEFCFVYQMLVRLNFYRANKMKKKAKKLEGVLASMPKRKAFVKRTFSQTVATDSRNSSTQSCLKVAQDRLEKTIGPLL